MDLSIRKFVQSLCMNIACGAGDAKAPCDPVAQQLRIILEDLGHEGAKTANIRMEFPRACQDRAIQLIGVLDGMASTPDRDFQLIDQRQRLAAQVERDIFVVGCAQHILAGLRILLAQQCAVAVWAVGLQGLALLFEAGAINMIDLAHDGTGRAWIEHAVQCVDAVFQRQFNRFVPGDAAIDQ
ncbi:MAG: hypothetical protein KGQ52_14050 [Alphaproteobacteria bacterium]|nr:hypothetical protein [Alphaproteobacteria bacterium]